MRVIELKQGFGIENLVATNRPEPEPGRGQVRVKMTCVSLNYRDLLMVQGHYNPRQPLPLIPCSDGVGVIDAVGENVTEFVTGDRVIGCFAQGWLDGALTRKAQAATLGGPLDGVLTELRCFPVNGVLKVPDYLTDEEASTLPCAGLTAWSALAEHGNLKPGERVLVLGTGGVSIFALQIAASIGAEVFITSSKDEKLAKARDLGANYGVNYKTHPEWHKEILRLSGGVDHVVEVGGAGTFDRSAKCLKPGGKMHLIGVLSGQNPPVNLTKVLMNHLRIQGIFVGHRLGLQNLIEHLNTHQLHPIIDQRFNLTDTPEAFRRLSKAEHFGKICINVSE